jgi:hypothetical protein
MKIQSYFLLICAAILFFTSCNKDEGVGGSSSLEGYVYQIRHWSENTNVIVDTIPAIDVRVKLTFGDDPYKFYGKDLRTDGNGLYRFDFLREGKYLVSAYSELIDGQEVRAFKTAQVKGALSKTDTIFVKSIVKRGFASIKGTVIADYYSGGRKVEEGPAMEKRVFINEFGADTHFDDVRTSDQGIFVFSNVLPGKYEIWTTTEDPRTGKLSPVKQVIEVIEREGVYVLKQEFRVIIA